MPQVPTASIEKNVKFQAAYTSLTFNKKNFAFYRMNGVLEGMQVASLGPTQMTVSPGAFIQRGIIIELLNPFVVNKPVFPFPWVIYATTDDEVATSPTTIDVAPSGSVPDGVIILATTNDGLAFAHSKQISIKALRAELDSIENERKFRTTILTNGGMELINPAKGISFIYPGPVMDGWQADNLSDKAPGSRIDIITDPAQTARGGGAVLLTSESYLDPGGLQPDGSVLPPRVRSNARIYQNILGYKDLIGEALTFCCALRLPPGHASQLHDLEISIYGSCIGTPGFSITPVDKFSYVIPAATLTENYRKFWIYGKITNLNAGLPAVPLPAFPGISVRIAFIDSQPDSMPTGVIDKVLIDDCMLYQGTVDNPVFFPLVPAADWLKAEELFEAQHFEAVQLGEATNSEYRLGRRIPFRTRKLAMPSTSIEAIVVNEDGQDPLINAEASYVKHFPATSAGEYLGMVTKEDNGFRPGRIKTFVRAQA